MNIVNIMLGKGRGGIEQAALDYAVGLREAGASILFITAPDASINKSATAQGCTLAHLPNLGAWDYFAALRLRRLCRDFKAECAILHGNRALSLAHLARFTVPLVVVAHNYNIRHFHKANAVFCITQHMRRSIIAAHPSLADACYHTPNMIPDINLSCDPFSGGIPRIGAMGRLVAKKGFDVWLKSLAMLRDQGISFEARLAGEGGEHAALESLCTALRLENHVTFTGWVANATEFYRDIDLFCVPSHHEPFGIVVIEAMAHGLPVIATNSEGPSEIVTNPAHGILVEKNNPEAMATVLTHLLDNPQTAREMGKNARTHALNTYNQRKCSAEMLGALQQITIRHRP